jgi:phospholipase/carboxylesterase
MTANPHLSTETATAGNPEAPAAAVVVHGRDQDPEYMLDQLVARLGLDDDVAYVLPRAADRSWYPGRFYDPMEDNEPCLGWSLEAIGGAVAKARGSGRALPRVALIGFSQGACIVAEHLARRPRPYGAAAILTGALFGSAADRMPVGSVDGLPMFFGIARGDDWIPVDAVRDTVEGFRRAGARCDLHVYDDQEHGINDDEIVAVRTLLTDLLERSA